MDQYLPTDYQQENERLSKIVDVLLELFPDPYQDFVEIEDLEIQDELNIRMNEAERLWLQKLQELVELLPNDASSPISLKFPNENIQREEIFNHIFAKLHQTLVVGKYKYKHSEANKQDQYRECLSITHMFLNKFDNGKLTPVNLLLWDQIIMNIVPKREVNAECEIKMGSYMNTIQNSFPNDEQVGQQIMNQLEQLVGQINNSPVLEQIYVEFSKQLGIPCGQQLSYAFKFCKLHYIYDPKTLGLTLMDGKIILNLFQITTCACSQKLLEKKIQTLTAYYLILLLHESAHFFLRKYAYEYEINTKENVKQSGTYPNYKQSGVTLENILMPPISEDNLKGIPIVNNLMAQFLLDTNSWKLSLNQFQNTLQELCQIKVTTFTIYLKGNQPRPSCIPGRKDRD